MVARKQPQTLLSSSISLLFSTLLTLSFIVSTSNAATDCAGSSTISVYRGQHSEEGTLKDTCDTNNYNIVIIESLIVFDNGTTPALNLANHCGTKENPCSNLEPEIKHCQDNGIKVFLSIGSDTSSSSPDEEDHTSNITKYLVDNFLSGNSGPLGNVSLDGIDLQDVSDSLHIHWDELVTILKTNSDINIYISASPQCPYPDTYLDPVLRTGDVDYIWVEFFYQNPCIYSDGNPNNLLDSFSTWVSNFPKSLIFLGLTPDETIAGYIEPENLIKEILPVVKKASNYGGVMIYDRNGDKKKDYSGQIKDSVAKNCKCVCDDEHEALFPGFNNMLLARS